MKNTCKFIAGSAVTICVLAAIGAVTVARYAVKHMNEDKHVDECGCDEDCEHCDLNAQPDNTTQTMAETVEAAEEPVEVTINAADSDVENVADKAPSED